MAVGFDRLRLNFNLLKKFNSTMRFVGWKSDTHIVTTDDNSVIVCWHPEKFFPYEKTRPIKNSNEGISQLSQSHSVLKIQSSKELLSVLKPKKQEIVRKELMAITHTVKHIWFPRAKLFRRKNQLAWTDLIFEF